MFNPILAVCFSEDLSKQNFPSRIEIPSLPRPPLLTAGRHYCPQCLPVRQKEKSQNRINGQTACCSFRLYEVIDTDLVTLHPFRPIFHFHYCAFFIPTSWSLDKFLLNTHSPMRPGLSNRNIM